MSFLSDLEKTLRTNHILVILGAIVLVYAVYTYSDQKFVVPYESLQTGANSRQTTTANTNQQSATQNVDAMTGQSGALPPTASQLPVANPADLLPRDTNNQWGSLNPSGSGDLQVVYLPLTSGYFYKIKKRLNCYLIEDACHAMGATYLYKNKYNDK
jgi:hypothetical protein